jgi:hypothetical protein
MTLHLKTESRRARQLRKAHMNSHHTPKVQQPALIHHAPTHESLWSRFIKWIKELLRWGGSNETPISES